MRHEFGGILQDGKQTGSTLQCCHCGVHWETVPGSGRLRGTCLKCMGPTCGRWECNECVPTEARIEHMEGAKNRYSDTIKDLVSRGAVLLCLLIVFSLGTWAQNPNTAVYPGGTVADKDLGVLSNHIQTTLSANIGSADTTAPVNSCTGFRTQQYVGIDTEIAMTCACSAGVMSFGKSSCPNIDGRGMDSSSAASHANGASVLAYIMATNFNQADAELKAIESNLNTPSAIRTKVCVVTFGDPGGASPALAVDNNAPEVCDNTTGLDWTIKAIACVADASGSSVNPILTGGNATSLLVAPISCGTTPNTAGSIAGSPVVHTFSANGATCAVTPCTIDAKLNAVNGTTKYIKLVISGTY